MSSYYDHALHHYHGIARKRRFYRPMRGDSGCYRIREHTGRGSGRIREAIEVVREAQNAELHRTIAAVHSEIIRIKVADPA